MAARRCVCLCFLLKVCWILYCFHCCQATKYTRPLSKPVCASTNTTCLKTAAMLGLSRHRQAHPEMGLPSLDPLFIESFLVRPNPKSKVCYTQRYSDIEFRGMSDANVTNFDVKVNSTHVYLNFSLHMDIFEMIGWYRWKGTVMEHALDGNGKCNITSVNVTHVHRITLKRKANDFLSMSRYEMDLDPTVLLFKLPNLVHDNPIESKKTERFFTEHGMPIFYEVKDDYDLIFAKIFYPYACAFFKNMRLQDLFLDF